MFSVGVKNQSNISLFLISHVSKYEQDFIKRQTGTHEKKESRRNLKNILRLLLYDILYTETCNCKSPQRKKENTF